MKWEDKYLNMYSLRSSVRNDVKNPEKPSTKCIGFTYTSAKLFNLLPSARTTEVHGRMTQ